MDVASRRIWTVSLKSKTDSDSAIKEVLEDSRARSGNQCKILRTDGDGIFRSQSFGELQKQFQFVHERQAPYDHDQSGLLDRECRTLLESVWVSIFQSGAPPSMWGEAVKHFTFTHNIPRIKRESEAKVFLSPENILVGK